mgnify:CR=1 FL=1
MGRASKRASPTAHAGWRKNPTQEADELNQLSRIMEERGVSTRELARRSGITISTIRKLRRDESPLAKGSLHTWAHLARALEVTLDELSGEHDGRI